MHVIACRRISLEQNEWKPGNTRIQQAQNLIGIGYSFSGISSPALWAALTGVLAILPFGAPVAFLSAAAMFASEENSSAAIGIAAWGSIVVFIADHFIRPVIIGNATRLPFLAVLFGIFGGLETFGLVGLFIGPVLMVLFITLTA